MSTVKAAIFATIRPAVHMPWMLSLCCRRLRTRFIEATHNPVWNERHEVYLADEADTIKLWVKVREGGLKE